MPVLSCVMPSKLYLAHTLQIHHLGIRIEGLEAAITTLLRMLLVLLGLAQLHFMGRPQHRGLGLRIHEIAENEGPRRAGLLTGGLEFKVTQYAGRLSRLVLGDAVTLHADRALLHISLVSHREVRIELH